MFYRLILGVAILVIFLPFYAESSIKKRPYINNSEPPLLTFTGRNQLISKIDKQLSLNENIVQVLGLAGIGKTQLIRKYTNLQARNHDIIWWFDCSADLASQLMELAKQINISLCNNGTKCSIEAKEDTIHMALKTFIDKSKFKWFFVFDDAHNINDINQIVKYIGNHTKVIVVSQEDKSILNTLLVPAFTEEETFKYLSENLEGRPKDEISIVAKLFKGYPLALENGVAYLRENPNLTAESYENIFNTESTNIIKISYTTPGNRGYNKSLEEAFNFIFNDIKNKNYIGYKLLNYTGYFVNSTIPNDILKKLYAYEVKSFSETEYLSCIRLLLKYSIINITNNSNQYITERDFYMHSLLQNIILGKIENKKIHRNNIAKILKAFRDILPEDVSQLYNYVDKHPGIVLNLEKLLQLSEEYKIEDANCFILQVKLLRIYLFQYNYNKAEKLITQVDQYLEKSLPRFVNNISPVYLASYYEKKAVFADFRYGNFQLSIDSLQKGLILVKGLEEGLSVYYSLLCQLVQTKIYSGNVKEEVRLYLDELKNIVESKQLTSNEGLYYFIKAKFEMEIDNLDNALEHVIKSIKIDKKEFGEKEPYNEFTAGGYLLLTEILLKKGQINKAYKALLPIIKMVEHPSYESSELLARTNILDAAIAGKLNNYKYAQVKITQAIRNIDEFYTEERQHLEDQEDNLADAFIVQGDIMDGNRQPEKALNFYLQALKIFTNRYGKEPSLARVGELYKKIVEVAIKCSDNFTANQYYMLHKQIFGFLHPRTKEIFSKIDSIA